ncbi:MAG: hypothetical protein M3Z36_13560 [Acidobacteriota bacterium]|nr:hypothetical protein [Acidobacteriota bacterium]
MSLERIFQIGPQAAQAALKKELPRFRETPHTDRDRGILSIEKGQPKDSLAFLLR